MAADVLIVHTPLTLRQRLKLGDFFLQDIMAHGKVLNEAADGCVGRAASRIAPHKGTGTGGDESAAVNSHMCRHAAPEAAEGAT